MEKIYIPSWAVTKTGLEHLENYLLLPEDVVWLKAAWLRLDILELLVDIVAVWLRLDILELLVDNVDILELLVDYICLIAWFWVKIL